LLAHDAGAAQDPELLGEGARLDLDGGKQLVDRVIPFAQQLQHADPDRVTDVAEQRCLGFVQRDGHSDSSTS